ncbi:MAG: LPXTG cell wall anchor domain-containing protein [Oligoflexia bacterium]|nr:LPXTG cell wall anchor domain-containing protein [Oligoflexia bacterium]MBF0366412.1 LPXTG cell wall anchor domain-containing protein [Oligoflexia bacterium]
MRTSMVIALFLVMMFSPAISFAKRFANEYTEFELPPGWECVLEGSEWVCQSENEERKKEAIIILVAKIRGEQDTIEQYLEYLKQTKSYTIPGGKSQVSEPKYSKQLVISDHPWIDALHLASEVPGFYTRYLATTKEDLGVAVTFSVGKDFYDAYQAVFDKVIASMRVFRQKQSKLPGYVKKSDENLFDSAALPDAKDTFAIEAKKKKESTSGTGGDDSMMLLLGLIGIGALAFFIIKRRKKQ